MVVDSNGDFKWNSNSDGSEASDSASERSQNSSLNSKNAKRIIGFGSCCEPYISEAANKRLKQTPMDSYKKVFLVVALVFVLILFVGFALVLFLSARWMDLEFFIIYFCGVYAS